MQKTTKYSLLALSTACLLSALPIVQAAGMSAGSSNGGEQRPNNPWGYAPYGQNYGYGAPNTADQRNPQNTAPWGMMPSPGSMVNMMPNPTRMFNGANNNNNNNRRNHANGYPQPAPGGYPYAYPPGAYPGYPSAYPTYPGAAAPPAPYQGVVPGQYSGAYRGAAPTAQSSAPQSAPQPETYPAQSNNNNSGGGMGMGSQRQNNYPPQRNQQNRQPPQHNWQNPDYAPNYPNYPNQGGLYAHPPGALMDRGDNPTPPAAMQPPGVNSSEQPLTDRGGFPDPPPVPEMPPQQQYPQSQGNTNQYPATQNYGYTAGASISPQAGGAYSVPPVAPGLDLYAGQKNDPHAPPPPLPPGN